MDCKKALTTVSLSTRLGSVEVEYSLLGQSIQEPSQQVNNTVIGVQPNQYSKSRLIGCFNHTVVTRLLAARQIPEPHCGNMTKQPYDVDEPQKFQNLK